MLKRSTKEKHAKNCGFNYGSKSLFLYFIMNTWIYRFCHRSEPVGEEKAVNSYSKSLKKALKLGKRSGLAKGLGVGLTYGLLFCAWALLFWYASLLVRHGKTNGAKAFTTILNVIYSGL